MKYVVKFEFYGHKMKTEVEADSVDQAKSIVTARLNFLDVKSIPQGTDPNFIKDFFGFK